MAGQLKRAEGRGVRTFSFFPAWPGSSPTLTLALTLTLTVTLRSLFTLALCRPLTRPPQMTIPWSSPYPPPLRGLASLIMGRSS